MNLMRPISMTLPMRPPSIYDVIGSDGEASGDESDGGGGAGGGVGGDDTLTTSFYLPKDTTKVIHISRCVGVTGVKEVTSLQDQSRAFALIWTRLSSNSQQTRLGMIVMGVASAALCGAICGVVCDAASLPFSARRRRRR